MFSKILFTLSLPRAALSFILSFCIRHRNLMLQLSSAFSSKSVFVPLLKPPIFSYSFSFKIISASKNHVLPSVIPNIHHPSPWHFPWILLSPWTHVLLKTLLPTWANSPLPYPLRSFWIPWAAQAGVTPSLHQFRLCWGLYKNAHAKLSADSILFLVFTAYNKDKSKRGRGMTITWV